MKRQGTEPGHGITNTPTNSPLTSSRVSIQAIVSGTGMVGVSSGDGGEMLHVGRRCVMGVVTLLQHAPRTSAAHVIHSLLARGGLPSRSHSWWPPVHRASAGTQFSHPFLTRARIASNACVCVCCLTLKRTASSPSMLRAADVLALLMLFKCKPPLDAIELGNRQPNASSSTGRDLEGGGARM